MTNFSLTLVMMMIIIVSLPVVLLTDEEIMSDFIQLIIHLEELLLMQSLKQLCEHFCEHLPHNTLIAVSVQIRVYLSYG